MIGPEPPPDDDDVTIVTPEVQTILADHKKSVLAASCIDPEQFRKAKVQAMNILDSVLNSDNYTYIDKKTQQAGGTANLALRRTLKEI